MFRTTSEAAVEAKLTTLQVIHLKNGESIIEYSSRILELVSELKCTGHAASRIEQNLLLLLGLPTELEVTLKSIMGAEDDFHEAVSKLWVREFFIKQLEDKIESVLAVHKNNLGRKCFS